MTNETLTILFGSGFTVAVGGWLWEAWKRKHPTEMERSQLRASNADFVKTYSDATAVHLELREHVKNMVAEETESLRKILVERELTHAQQIESFVKSLAAEKELKEDYWKQFKETQEALKQAREEVVYWETLYKELKTKYENIKK